MGHKTAVSRPLPASTLLLDRSTPRVNLIQGRRVFLRLRCISRINIGRVSSEAYIFPETAARTDPSLTSSSPTFYQRPSVRRLVSPYLAFRDPYYTSRLNFIRGMSHHSHEYQH
ncbi:hypothetical protein PUN28_014978 [Cardiocondyla obscurior]|uniref:Uncharacterized protein n=1 Tax=Cardiocondyla obscurior TaxID=286306 RepID=A0AAW2EWD3_9HYME